MDQAKCPYCDADYAATGGKCSSCGRRFPWLQEIDKLREEAREREVNRGRATFALLEELYRAAKDGKPVSLSVVKGFAFAWLFPRTLIVIGSICTGLLVAAQTWILYNQNSLIGDQTTLLSKQTELLAGQTRAAQLDQAEKLRERIVRRQKLAAHLSLSRHQFTAFVSHTCSDSCASATLQDVLQREERHEAVSNDLNDPLVVFRNQTRLVSQTVALVAGRPTGASTETFRSNEASGVLSPLLSDAELHCYFAQKSSHDVVEATRAFEQWTSERVGRGINKADLRMSKAFYFGVALGRLKSVKTGQTEVFRVEKLEEVDVEKFLELITYARKQIASGLEIAASACLDQVAKDVAALSRLEDAQRPASGLASSNSASSARRQ
jgi:hypothetical protein